MDELLFKPETKNELKKYLKPYKDYYHEEDTLYAGCTACIALITR